MFVLNIKFHGQNYANAYNSRYKQQSANKTEKKLKWSILKLFSLIKMTAIKKSNQLKADSALPLPAVGILGQHNVNIPHPN